MSSKLLIIVSTKKPSWKNERKQFDLSFWRIVKFYPWVFYYIFISNHKCIHSFLCCHHFDIELKTFDSNKFEFKHCVPYFNFLSFAVIKDVFDLNVKVSLWRIFKMFRQMSNVWNINIVKSLTFCHLTLTLVQIYLECVQAEALKEVVQERNKLLQPNFRILSM